MLIIVILCRILVILVADQDRKMELSPQFFPLHSHVDCRRTMFRLFELDSFTGDINLSIIHSGSRTNFHMHHQQTDLVGVICGELDWFMCTEPASKGGKIVRVHLNPHILATQGLLKVPPRVYHASFNDFGKDAYLIYKIDQHYNPMDEFRLTWQESEFAWEREVK